MAAYLTAVRVFTPPLKGRAQDSPPLFFYTAFELAGMGITGWLRGCW